MGCASSSPLMNGSGGIVGAAKSAANDAVHAGEDVLHDVSDQINGTVGHVKEAVVGAVQGIGHGLDGVMHGVSNEATSAIKSVETTMNGLPSIPTTSNKTGVNLQQQVNNTKMMDDDKAKEFTYIPLKDPNSTNVDDNLEEFKENLMRKAESFSDSADKMADDLIKETDDILDDAGDKTKSIMVDKLESITTDTIINNNQIADNKKTPTHSIDSLKTNSPEPEIEKAISNEKSPPSPEPTLSEMSDIKNNDDVDGNDTAAAANKMPLSSEQKFIISNGKNNSSTENKELLSKYSKFFLTRSTGSNDSNNNNQHHDEFDTILEETIESGENNNEQKLSSPIDVPINEPTQWEILADAILAKPVTRFTDNPTYPLTFHEGMQLGLDHLMELEKIDTVATSTTSK